ncbi:ester cyclase [Sinorhizobium americanum]|nr:ester cyclase [Sinorhizobium americanum]
MAIDRAQLSPQKEVVRKFYQDMWDRADVSLIPEIFHKDFTFRGSLGPVLVGHSQFSEYVRWVTESLEDYTSDILGMVEEGNQVSGKLRFHGFHRKPLFGRAPTGRHVWWYGAPIFTFDGPKVRDLWVLGDIHGLISRMNDGQTEEADFSANASTLSIGTNA